ncbi:class I SAM-dependent methyltransferase [Oleisolibacter albus]|uniref:class I SAM-dependent methyltransferase n=1 Tax=Oleisolibacter albus TaxID=2171757 RepID=UPI000DF1A16B|nr:SAM-dependent methyltransferase [Oleisolibacter albus]
MPTPLQALIARRITLDGPLGVGDYMALCLGHPQHGYYTTRDPLGTAGDFTTAPEISQMFGELLGVWAAQCWLQMGQPAPVHLVELGPGRGTLMADALRATARIPGFHAALRLHLVETSPVLRQRQAAALRSVAPVWHDRLAEVPEGPLLLLANEFFDALPIRQFERGPLGWGERKVGLDETGALVWRLDRRPGDCLVPPPLRPAPPGSVVERAPLGEAIAAEIGARLARCPGSALIVDYGYEGPALGDTLQAMRSHAFVPVLERPGEADLTAHVDFTALAGSARQAGAAAWGTRTQGDFLRRLGIDMRAAALKRVATPAQATDIELARHRLTGDDAMGRLFKVLALTSPALPAPAGFDGPAGFDATTGADRP